MKKIFFILICFLASISLFSAEISKEDFQKAKDFFVGKTLYKDPRSNAAKIHTDTYKQWPVIPNTGYKIKKVTKKKASSLFPFSLQLESEGKTKLFIDTDKPNEEPLGFVFDINEKNPKKYFVHHEYDELEKTKFSITRNCLQADNIRKVCFDVSIGNNNTSPLFSISYDAKNWLFIENASIYTDDEKVTLDITDTDRNIRYGGISELLQGPISVADILKIINSEEVTLRIIGDNGQKDFKFWPQNLYNLQRFYEEEIK